MASSASSVFNLGNGLIEISALTSMIGSGTALRLALGNKGPGGFVWATMSSFGAMSVVKACLAAVIPAFLLDSLGARSQDVDAVLGYKLDLNKHFDHRNRSAVAKGIEVGHDRLDHDLETRSQKRHYVHVFDQRITNNLESFSLSDAGDGLKVYSYATDPYQRERILAKAHRVDAIGISLYSVKLGEVAALWMHDAYVLAVISFSSWLLFLLAGLVLFAQDFFYGRRKGVLNPHIDVLIGSLPTPSTKGGSHAVLLGIPADIRSTALWRTVWALSSIVSSASVTASYIVLGRAEDFEPFVIWTGFQIVWLILRSLYFFAVSDRELYHFELMVPKDWKVLSPQERRRVQYLVFALSKYQHHIHPRGPWSYRDDIGELDKLEDVQAYYPLPAVASSTVQILVDSIIGDALLSSVAWISGSPKGGYDLYDTCIIRFSLKDRTISIPAARVLAPPAAPTIYSDEELEINTRHPPRGGSNTGTHVEWWYWIPCADDRWLCFRTNQLKSKGTHQTQLLNDEQVSEQLRRGDLFASLKDVSEVKETVRNSTLTCEYLLELLSSR